MSVVNTLHPLPSRGLVGPPQSGQIGPGAAVRRALFGRAAVRPVDAQLVSGPAVSAGVRAQAGLLVTHVRCGAGAVHPGGMGLG